jgi:hypothetical protein
MESHHMTGGACGEPLAPGQVGARVRVPLTGTPSAEWSRAFTAHLTQHLTGHHHVGHLHLDHVVQGSDLVLDGVEDPEAGALGTCLHRAVEAANGACHDDRPSEPGNMSRQQADAIAHQVEQDAR